MGGRREEEEERKRKTDRRRKRNSRSIMVFVNLAIIKLGMPVVQSEHFFQEEIAQLPK